VEKIGNRDFSIPDLKFCFQNVVAPRGSYPSRGNEGGGVGGSLHYGDFNPPIHPCAGPGGGAGAPPGRRWYGIGRPGRRGAFGVRTARQNLKTKKNEPEKILGEKLDNLLLIIYSDKKHHGNFNNPKKMWHKTCQSYWGSFAPEKNQNKIHCTMICLPSIVAQCSQSTMPRGPRRFFYVFTNWEKA